MQVHLARHGPGLRRVQVLHPGHPGGGHAGARLPLQRAGQHLHPGDARGRLAPGRVRRRGGPRSRAGAERRGLHRAHPRPVRGRARRTRPGRQQLAVDRLHHRALPDLAARQRGPARRRGAHRALLDRFGYQARHGRRAGPGRLPARAAGRRRWPGRLRGRTQAGGRLDPAGRAGQPGVVREHRPVRRPGPAPVRVQHRDPQPPGHLRQPPAARPGVRGGHGPLVRREPGWGLGGPR